MASPGKQGAGRAGRVRGTSSSSSSSSTSTAISRRRWIASSSASALTLLRGQRDALALDLEGLRTKLRTGGRNMPKAVKFPRARVDDVVAVACMRSLYSTVEDLELVPDMQVYQKDFWLYRAEVQPEYVDGLSPLSPRIGDLTDPLYLDFISYSQFHVAGQKLQQAGADAALVDDFEARVGASILSRLGVGDLQGDPPAPAVRGPGEEGEFRSDFVEGGAVALPEPPATAPAVDLDLTTRLREAAAAGPRPLADAWLQHLCSKGYALRATTSEVPPDPPTLGLSKFEARVVGPATLWGTEFLQAESSSRRYLPLANAFDAYATKALLKRAGFDAGCEIRSDEKNAIQAWTVRKYV